MVSEWVLMLACSSGLADAVVASISMTGFFVVLGLMIWKSS